MASELAQAYANASAPACSSACIPVGGSQLCSTLACSSQPLRVAGKVCRQFNLNTLPGCYCRTQLIDKLSELGAPASAVACARSAGTHTSTAGFIEGGKWLQQNEADLCGSFVAAFFAGPAAHPAEWLH